MKITDEELSELTSIEECRVFKNPEKLNLIVRELILLRAECRAARVWLYSPNPTPENLVKDFFYTRKATDDAGFGL